jgi:hypothetical protein
MSANSAFASFRSLRILTAGRVSKGKADSEDQGNGSDSSTPFGEESANSSVSAKVREWAMDAEPQEPSYAEGEAISVNRTITNNLGYEQDGMEYFPAIQTI